MKPLRRPIVDLGEPAAARWSLAVAGTLAAASAGWAIFGAVGQRAHYIADCALLASIGPEAAPTESPLPHAPGAVVASTRAPATLWAELFPAPPPQPEPAPPPTLSLELVAVISSSGGRRAFLFDKTAQRYFELGAGEDVAGSGAARARLTAVGERHALFELGGREIRLELAP